VTLPNEYKAALIYNLAVMMAEDHFIAPNKSVIETAQYTRLLISRLGAINRPPKEASFEFTNNKTYQIETDIY
jgi:hypothetical protein